MKKLSRGFTLIELLVVITIIAILAGLIFANIFSSRSKARDAKRISDINQIQLALEQFFDKCQAYPTALSTTGSVTTGYCNTNNVTLGNFISVLPTDPVTKAIYDYHTNPTNYLDYVLHASLENPNGAISDALSSDAIGTNGYGTGAFACAPTVKDYCIGPK